MLCALVALSALSFAEIEIPATVGPLGRVLPEIGARLDIKLLAEPSVRDDVIGVVSPARPVQEILDGIAKATNGTWEKRPEGLVLVRSRKQEAEDAETDAKFRESWIRASLESTPVSEPFDQTRADALAAYWYEFKAKKEYSNSDYAQLDTMNARSPLGRFTRRLVEAFGVERLARLPQRTVTVFSTKPTRMQRALDIPNLDSVVKTYVEEQNRYAAAIEKVGRPPNGHNGMFVSGFDTTRAIAPEWDKIRVCIDTKSPSQTFLNVEFCSADGKLTSSARANFHRRYQPAESPVASAVTIPYDESALAVLKALGKPYSSIPDAPMLPDVLTRDPLDYSHRAALDAWSKEVKKPVFAVLSDEVMSMNLNEPYRLSTYRTNLSFNHRVDESELAVTIRPTDVTLARLDRINRVALQQAIKDRLTRGYITVENAMNLLTSRPIDATGSYNAVLHSTLAEIQSFTSSTMAFHFMAVAPVAQRNTLLAGTTVGWNDMNEAQRSLVSKLLFGYARSWGAGMSMNMDGRDPLPAEPTEAFPDGPPPTLFVKTENRVEDGARVQQGTRIWTSTVSQLGGTLFHQGEPKGMYQFAKIRTLTLNMSFTPYRSIGYHVVEAQVNPKNSWGAYETLPQSLRDEAARLAERYRRGVPPNR